MFKKGVSFVGRKGVISRKKCKFYGKSYSQKQLTFRKGLSIPRKRCNHSEKVFIFNKRY